MFPLYLALLTSRMRRVQAKTRCKMQMCAPIVVEVCSFERK
jgi:hypothetical protein